IACHAVLERLYRMTANLRWTCAALAVAAWLLLCLWAWLRHRRPAAVHADADADFCVVHASQTGQAEQLAQQTALTLRACGASVNVIGLDQLDATQLRTWPTVLFVASTSGEGDPPDAAAAFAGQAERGLPD